MKYVKIVFSLLTVAAIIAGLMVWKLGVFVNGQSSVSPGEVVNLCLPLDALVIKQYHSGERQPTYYPAGRLSRVALYYYSPWNTENWSIDKVVVFLKDGSTETHLPLKVMTVSLMVTDVHHKPVDIEQHFIRSKQ